MCMLLTQQCENLPLAAFLHHLHLSHVPSVNQIKYMLNIYINGSHNIFEDAGYNTVS